VAIDSVLHILIGGLIALFLFSSKVPGIIILFALISLASGKEIYDHASVLGHCYPACMDEHFSDFFFSLLFFFLYIPILALTQKSSPQLAYKHYIVIWACVASTHFAFKDYIDQQNKNKFASLSSCCSCAIK